MDELLATPSWDVQEAYYNAIASGSCIRVKQTQAMGKGAFAVNSIRADQVILCEPPLVGMQHSHNRGDAVVCNYCFCYVGSVLHQIKQKLQTNTGISCCDDDEDVAPPAEALELLAEEAFRLPFEEQFPLPEIVHCPGGCDEVFCSDACAEAAWDAYHALLCVGSSGLCENKEALRRFKQFADDTNDIFHLASQVVAMVILRARKLAKSASKDRVYLLEACKPFAMGHKRLWWEAIALPEDVDAKEETSFRREIKELASDSLQLLKEALYEEDYAPLFSLEVYGRLIGMFELNNLEIVVASPVEDYFLYIDELEADLKLHAENIVRPLLDALGSRYATFCQGTGFFTLQSCLNHSCEPNAKAFKRDEDKNGHAVVLATRDIAEGEQIFISYIDEGAPYWERRTLLADYGFHCQCAKCCQEADA